MYFLIFIIYIHYLFKIMYPNLMSPVFQNPMIQKITFYVRNFHSVSSNRDFKMGKQNVWQD